MLRGSSLTAATVAVVRSDASPQAVLRALAASENCDSDLIRVVGRRDNSDSVTLTFDIYVQQRRSALQTASTLPLLPTPSPSAPSASRKCSWATLQRLRTDLLAIVGTDKSDNRSDCDQCKHCRQLAAYLEHCFERPAMFSRSWNGAMVLSVKKAAHFVNTALGFARSMSEESSGCSSSAPSHEQVVGVLSSFLVPDIKKTE